MHLGAMSYAMIGALPTSDDETGESRTSATASRSRVPAASRVLTMAESTYATTFVPCRARGWRTVGSQVLSVANLLLLYASSGRMWLVRWASLHQCSRLRPRLYVQKVRTTYCTYRGALRTHTRPQLPFFDWLGGHCSLWDHTRAFGSLWHDYAICSLWHNRAIKLRRHSRRAGASALLRALRRLLLLYTRTRTQTPV